MLIFLADGIASVYLELISVDGDWYSEEMENSSSLVLCSLSTRALQKLRNKVLLPYLTDFVICNVILSGIIVCPYGTK
jgi:hypothetical protein